MHVIFWTGVNIGEFLFQGFNIVTTKGFIAICLGLGCLAFIAEGSRAWFLNLQSNGCALITKLTTLEQVPISSNPKYSTYICRAAQALFFAINLSLAYIMMCAVMTYNAAIFLSIIIGSGLGYAVFHAAPVSIRLIERKELERPNEPLIIDDTVSDVHDIGPGGAIVNLRYTTTSDTPLMSTRNVSNS